MEALNIFMIEQPGRGGLERSKGALVGGGLS